MPWAKRCKTVKRLMAGAAALLLALTLSACGAGDSAAPGKAPEAEAAAGTALPQPPAEEKTPAVGQTETVEKTGEELTVFKMKIGDTAVAVDWEENEAVEALKELCRAEPLTIELSMYGGFEQVGPIGARLPSRDVQTTTRAGDIVLYSSNQMVVFYGSNSWAYTRLGHISDQSAEDMAALLGHGDVSVTLWLEAEG